ncbi:uncharacterized protein LOC131596966 [Vicia villosa]|uniref:uncharacterized protein LOC131596966 n=1 Tax=Vicia villosa TaxID=3911 RepID=UPI00273BCA22|nr:uncharacterized protein LOC131596966 [Vicia villosa]
MKVKCSFRLRYVPSGICWKVMVRCRMNNHKLFEDLEGHHLLGRLKDHERKFMNDMTKYNMALRYKDSKNLTNVTQMYKARATYITGKIGSLIEMEMLLILVYKEKYMCWTINRDKSDVVADIFWTHPDSVKYWIRLLETVGVTSTKLTFLVVFANLEHEREENFTWALEKLKELFSLEKLLPKVVVTDREFALMNAMESVFPDASHLLYISLIEAILDCIHEMRIHIHGLRECMSLE